MLSITSTTRVAVAFMIFAASASVQATGPVPTPASSPTGTPTPTYSTYYFSGNCQDCNPGNTPATAVLTLQNYTPYTALTDANFVSLTYHSNLVDFTSTPNGSYPIGPFDNDVSNFLSGSLGTTQGSYNVSFEEDSYFFISSYSTVFNTLTDGSFSLAQGSQNILIEDQGNNGLWNDGSPVVTSGVPEPVTWASMIVGLALVGARMRRRRVRVSFAGAS